jgi:glycosyltransferase involved in cell wall biosynthesis
MSNHSNITIADNITGNQPKSILMLHGSSDIYGASKIFLITATLLQEENYKIFTVLSEEGPLADQLRAADINVIICRLGILRRKYFSVKGMINRFSVLRKARKNLIKIVKQHQIDIVYSNTAGVLIGAFVAKSCKIKHIWHLHEIIERPAIFSKLIGSLINKYSDKVIVVSNEVKKHWAKHIHADKMVTIHNGMDYTAFTSAISSIRDETNVREDEVLIGMIGRVNQWKGQKYFLQIASLLAKQFPNVRFLLAGDAYPGYEYLHQELHDIIKKENLSSKVTDLGFRTDVPNILKGLDIFILPSILPDPLPTIVLESMACGRPVVATAHGGALEMVDAPNTGVLIPWNDAELAVKKFASLINDVITRENMGKAGKERVLNLFTKKQYETNILFTINSI